MVEQAVGLTDDVLYEVCGIAPGGPEVTGDVRADLRAAASLAGRPRSAGGAAVQQAVVLLTAALGKLPQHAVTQLPFGFEGPRVQHEGWVNRGTVEAAAKQILGLTREDATPGVVAVTVEAAVTEAVQCGFLRESGYDAWYPGMPTGSGWRQAVRATPYGVQKARATPEARSAAAVVVTETSATQAPAAGDREIDDLSRDADDCLMHLGAIRRALDGMGGVEAHYDPGEDDMEFGSKADRTRYLDLSTDLTAAVGRLQEPLTRVLAWGGRNGVDVPDAAGMFSGQVSWSVRADVCEAAVRDVTRALARGRTRPSAGPTAVAAAAGETCDGAAPRRVEDALADLERAVERHRLLFLFTAFPKRLTPGGGWETLPPDEYPNDKIPTDDFDNDGEFLFKHRWLLDRCAQGAVEHFGPGLGSRPTAAREDGTFAEVEGGSLPVWSVDELDCSVLEQSSDAMLAACKALSRADVARRFEPLVRRARRLMHDEGQSRWYACVLVRWEYLARLDDLIAAIKSAEIDFPEHPSATGAVATAPAAGVQSVNGAGPDLCPAARRDPGAVWRAAETMAGVASKLFFHALMVRKGKPSDYDDQDVLSRDARMVHRNGYLLVSVARHLSLDAGPLLRILENDRLWGWPVEEGDLAIFTAAGDVARRIATEAKIWCAEAGVDPLAGFVTVGTADVPAAASAGEDGGGRSAEEAVAAGAPPTAPTAAAVSDGEPAFLDEAVFAATPAPGSEPLKNAAQNMAPDQWRSAGLGLLMMLAQVYYEMLQCTVSMASWCTSLDMELNQYYLWATQNLTNLLKNHEALRDFPEPFTPLFADLYPATIRDLEWEDMVAPDAERFLSTVQRYVYAQGFRESEPQSPAWVFIEMFRPSVTAAVDCANQYAERMRQHVQRLMAKSPPSTPAPPAGHAQEESAPPPAPSSPPGGQVAAPDSPAVRLAEVLAGARWSDVRIKFKDGHTVGVTVRGRSAEFDYRALGMAAGRRNRPAKHWELLHLLARRDGQLHWGDRGAAGELQKRKERLSKALGRAFGIGGEPIMLDGGGWKTRFHLSGG